MISIAENSRAENLRLIKNVAITLLCLAGASAAGYHLYLDFYESGGLNRTAPVATLIHSESQVKRKASSSFVWERAHSAESLYRKDSVQSGPASSALIQMKNGTRVELGENSLVIIDD